MTRAVVVVYYHLTHDFHLTNKIAPPTRPWALRTWLQMFVSEHYHYLSLSAPLPHVWPRQPRSTPLGTCRYITVVSPTTCSSVLNESTTAWFSGLLCSILRSVKTACSRKSVNRNRVTISYIPPSHRGVNVRAFRMGL
jgi:hypothetical protein